MQPSICIPTCPTVAPPPLPTDPLPVAWPVWALPAIVVLALALGVGVVLYLLAMMESLRRWVSRRLEK